MPRYLILRLEAPLVAFGGESIDNLGVIREFPALSMITGLIANALGWDRSEGARHDALQARLRVGSAVLRAGPRLQDFQTARLGGNDRGWTTRGEPEGRAGGQAAYENPHLRYRDYWPDARTVVVLTLMPASQPTLDDVAGALDRPARPLFIGRKPCVPNARLNDGQVDAASIPQALAMAVARTGMRQPVRAQWPASEPMSSAADHRREDVCDERNWVTGLHGGWRPVVTGMLHPLGEST